MVRGNNILRDGFQIIILIILIFAIFPLLASQLFDAILKGLIIGIVLAIYLYDMFICIYTDSPLPLAELATFLVLFIGTLIFTVVFRKDLRSLMQKQKSKTKFLNKANMHFSHNKVRKGFFSGRYYPRTI